MATDLEIGKSFIMTIIGLIVFIVSLVVISYETSWLVGVMLWVMLIGRTLVKKNGELLIKFTNQAESSN